MNDPYALLADAREGNQEALGRLLEMYRPYLKLLSRLEFNRRMQSRLDSSDLIQETALQAQRDINDFRGNTEKEFTSWLRRIMANVAAAPVGTTDDNDVTSRWNGNYTSALTDRLGSSNKR